MTNFFYLRFVITVASFAGMASSALADALTAECPVTLAEDALKPGKAVPGWQTVPSQQHLEAAGMMAGAPETESYLVPDKSTKTQQTWAFERGAERWMWCGYSGMRIMRRLDDKATTCIITMKKQKPEHRMTASVVCK